MDANETRYHLLLGYDDWSACTENGQPLRLSWDSPLTDNAPSAAWNSRRQEVTLQQRLFQFKASKNDTRPQLSDRRGGARDRFGNFYWIDVSKTEIRVNSAGDERTSHFWASADRIDQHPTPRYGAFVPKDPPAAPSLEFSGLAVTEDHYLVVGVLNPPGLLIFDLHAGGAPQEIVWPGHVPFEPFDMAAAPGGGVWILDKVNGRYWALDRYFSVIRREQVELTLRANQQDDFQPLAGGEIRQSGTGVFPAGITFDSASPLALASPVAIEALPDGTVLILDSVAGQPFSTVYRFRFSRQLGTPTSTEGMASTIDSDNRADFQLLGHDFAFVPADPPTVKDGRKLLGTLSIVGQDGNQAFDFDLYEVGSVGAFALDPIAEYLPMRLFGGKGLIASGGQVYYDFDDRWIPLIGQRRPRYVDAAVLLTPSGESRPAFDGRDPDCVWHRLLIDARIPSDTEIRISSRAANDPDELPFTDWQREPRLYARRDGSELPFVDEGDYSTWELLLQRATGRYLQLKLEILGSGQHTPSLRALRVYYPRFSYLNHYLPAVYRDDLNSASFLDRFLSNIEGFFTTIEDKIAAVGILFDVHSAPQEALDWLAGWMGIAFDSGWDAARRRLFIKHALFFFSRRGTIPGLTMALQLALDECPEDAIFDSNPNARRIQASGIRIVENYRARRTPGVVLGDPTESSGLRLVPKAQPWLPDEGNSGLQQRYQEFMSARNVKEGTVPSFSTTPPSDAVLQKLWQQFAQETLSFVPAVGTDAAQWCSFLTRRYQFVDRYNDSYRLTGAARITRFEDATFPINIPGDGAPLQDWYQYQAVFLPMQATAHRFTVLLPVRPGYQDPTKQADALDLVNRILNLEKPAHTTFEVRLYWAMFRLGEVRLGFDTLIDRGSRAPELMTPMILGQGHLMESYLAPSHPQDVRDRQVLGRDRLQN